MLDVIDVRARIRSALEARYLYVDRMQSGTPMRFGAAVVATPDGLFRLVTLCESVVLTAGLVRRIAGQVVWAWCSTPLIIDDPDPAIADHQPVSEIRGLVMIYPHGPRPCGYTSVDVAVWPDFAEVDPLVLGMITRPAGWPP